MYVKTVRCTDDVHEHSKKYCIKKHEKQKCCLLVLVTLFLVSLIMSLVCVQPQIVSLVSILVLS